MPLLQKSRVLTVAATLWIGLVPAAQGQVSIEEDELVIKNDFFDESIEIFTGAISGILIRSNNSSNEDFAFLEPGSLKMTRTGVGSGSLFYSYSLLPRGWIITGSGVVKLQGLSNGWETSLQPENGGLILASQNPSQRYLVDADDNDALANHIWYENSVIGTPTDFRMMQLSEVSGGSLFVDGPVTQNHSFDLAETFWESEPIEPGELVAIDLDRKSSVRRSATDYQATLLGVASAQPGFVLGGGAFSLTDLRATWGEAIAAEYERQRPTLELAVFAELPELERAALRLSSQAAFRAYLETTDAAALGSRDEARLPDSAPPSQETLTAAYARALDDHRTVMFDRTVQRFFKDHFSAVALAGRVPVKADASFGAIRPGDYLTSSPIPGVAMKASRSGPVVGTALEALSTGTGAIEIFVHRGWYGGGGQDLGLASAALPDGRDRKIAELQQRLANLEGQLERLLALAARSGPAELAETALNRQASLGEKRCAHLRGAKGTS